MQSGFKKADNFEKVTKIRVLRICNRTAQDSHPLKLKYF